MAKPTIRKVAVIGTGVIGRSWIQVFARAGCETRVYDASTDQLRKAMAWFTGDVASLRERGEIKKKKAKARVGRVTACQTLAEALEGVGYAQESGPESLEQKRALYAELDRAAPADVVLGSSTSANDMTEIARGLAGARRCIVAHPVNPPHVVPVVEVLGGAETAADVVEATMAFLRSVGQSPVLMRRFVPGFLINRMQAALIREAVDLVASGVAGVEAVDTTIRDGLGLRWAFMGPYAVANTNADGGVAEYFTRYRQAYHDLWADLRTDVRLTDALVEELHRQAEAMLGPDRAAQRAWRDRMIMAIRRTRAKLPAPKPRSPRRKPNGTTTRKGSGS
jgi:3-hydroxyacyl-CoA dehydrogenase